MKRIVILGTVVIAVVALWTAGWLFAAGEMRRTIAALGVDDGSGNPTVTCGDLGVAGYPFRLDVTCTDATIALEDLTATFAELKGTMLVYRLNQALLFARAPLVIADAFSGAESRVTWASLESSLRLVDWRIARFSLVAENINWVDTLATEALIANAGHLEVHVVDLPERLDRMNHTAAAVLLARLTGLTAPAQGITAGDSELEAEITGLPDQIWALGEPDAVQRWQAAGGEIRLNRLRSEDGSNFLDASGTVTLDAGGRPEGQLEIGSRGLVELIEGLIAPEVRPLVLGAPAADGSYRHTLTISEGVILAGLIPVGMVPPLW